MTDLKKLLRTVLTLCMVLALIPTATASAAGTTKTINLGTYTLTMTDVYASDQVSTSGGDGHTTIYFVVAGENATISCSNFNEPWPSWYLVWPFSRIDFPTGARYPDLDRACEYEEAENIRFEGGSDFPIIPGNEYYFTGGSNGVWHGVRLFLVEDEKAAQFAPAPVATPKPTPEPTPEPVVEVEEVAVPEPELISAPIIIESPEVTASEPLVYPVLESFGEWTGIGTATATIDADLSALLELFCDGNTVDATSYTIADNTIVLGESYLSALENGSYVLTAMFEDGESEDIALTVTQAVAVAQPETEPVPEPEVAPESDNSTALLIGGAVAVCVLGAVFVMKGKKPQA